MNDYPRDLKVANNFKNLFGRKFGRLTVDEFVGIDKDNRALWLCRCRCGQWITVNSNRLTRAQKPGSKASTRSCGCLHREQLIRRNKRQAKGKTHCPSGHPYSGSNLRITKTGFRRCKECDRIREREARRRRKDSSSGD